MTIKIILTVNDGKEPSEVHSQLRERYGINFTALLELALQHWDAIKSDDPDLLRTALEGAAIRGLYRKQYDYKEFMEVVEALCKAIQQIHDVVDRALTPFLNATPHNGDLTMRLVRWLAEAAVVEINPRLS